MRNRIHRYQQRSYKYREQERIPEYFLGEDPYYYFYNEYDWYYCPRRRDGWYYYPTRSDNYIDISDCESVDSYSEYKIYKPAKNSRSKKNKNKYPSKRINNYNNNSHNISVAAVRNRYEALDMEESSLLILLSEDNKQQGTHPDRKVKEEEEETEANVKNSSGEKDISGETDAAMERQKWIDSWSKRDTSDDSVSDEDETWVITVDGFFRKNRKAGYGVMIRNRYGVPLLASASVYEQGKPVSWVYHALQGINRGLELAIKYGFQNVELFYTLPYAVDRIIQRSLDKRIYGRYSIPCDSEAKDLVCKTCLISVCKGQDEFQLVYPLIHEVVQKFYMFDYSQLFCSNVKRRYNVPADYLAKLQVNKKEMKPDEFSEELKAMLYADAHNSKMMMSRADGQKWSIFPVRIVPNQNCITYNHMCY